MDAGAPSPSRSTRPPGREAGGRGGWRVVSTADGSPTLAHPEHGETCHGVEGAWTEALERYALPCRLAERARADEELRRRGRLRLLDVGTGLGWNLAAALAALEGTGVALDVLTLEVDPEPVRSAAALLDDYAGPGAREHARLRHALTDALARAAAAADGRGESALPDGGRLVVALGDGRRQLPGAPFPERFDAVFLDPFSPRVDPPLWEPAFLRDVAVRMAPQSWLSTYTVAFAVRVALAEAGLAVGRGPRVGAKAEGTLATPDQVPPPLDERTARRLARRVGA